MPRSNRLGIGDNKDHEHSARAFNINCEAQRSPYSHGALTGAAAWPLAARPQPGKAAWDDPRVALSGVDKIDARKLMAKVGFDCIIDAGLGRTSSNFDQYRVTVFDHVRPIDRHFAGQKDNPLDEAILESEAYQRLDLEAEIGRCGTAEVAGASVAAPYVSALAAAVAISRLIAVASGCASLPARYGGSAGTVRRARAQDDPAQGEARQAERGNGQARGLREANVGLARQPNLAH
jgi:hypothetical protein